MKKFMIVKRFRLCYYIIYNKIDLWILFVENVLNLLINLDEIMNKIHIWNTNNINWPGELMILISHFAHWWTKIAKCGTNELKSDKIWWKVNKQFNIL